MFSFFKTQEKIEIDLPIPGEVMDITEVPDAVFSQKMMGEGIAIIPEGNTIIAPCDGKITMLSSTKHAVGINVQGVELLIHVGLDTVELEGEGFEAKVQAGDPVRKGQALILFDRDFITAQGKSLITPIIILNMDAKVKKLRKHVNVEEGKIFTIELK